MPKDSKKNQKSKNEPKDQRKRRGRQQAAPAEKKLEKHPESTKAPEKPAYEPPPPEFYQNLKRETDEILKITEEANSKYKKKEIQSNWAKYEMPIESYDKIDEQENLGADYETLIQAPLTVGGHFQFKHEKSWDISTGPSPYDKYFDINKDNLFIALSTIPFYERNSIDKSFFTETDMQSMNHRANTFKYKYSKDKTNLTSKIEANVKIQNILKSKNEEEPTEIKLDDKLISKNDEVLNQLNNIKLEEYKEGINNASKNIVLKDNNEVNDSVIEPIISINESVPENSKAASVDNVSKNPNKLDKVIENPKDSYSNTDQKIIDNDLNELLQNEIFHKNDNIEKVTEPANKVDISIPVDILTKKKESPKAHGPQKDRTSIQNPVIESPEDLEKWLDDFLDG